MGVPTAVGGGQTSTIVTARLRGMLPPSRGLTPLTGTTGAPRAQTAIPDLEPAS